MIVEVSCQPHPEESNTWLLFIELSAREEHSGERVPAHLALAIDASSSMGGPRLTRAIEAARAVADRLGPNDLFCLLAFDRTVRCLFGPGKVDDAARKEIHVALDQLKPGVGTALHAAVERAHEALQRVYVRDARPRAIILTDGYPSVGPAEPAAFAALAQKAASAGIVTSSVGVGLDYDEDAVSAMASAGGRYSFVDNGADIPGALALHLSDLFAVAVEGVTLRVAPATGVQEAVLLHRYPTRVGPDGFIVETGPVGRGSPRRLLFRLKASAPPSPVAAKIAVSTKGGDHEPDRILSVAVDPEAPCAKEGLRELYRLRLADRESEFWSAVRRSDRPLAQQAHGAALQEMLKLIAAGAPSAEADTDRLRLEDQRAVLEGRLTQEAREAARRRSHHTSISRITSLTSLKDSED